MCNTVFTPKPGGKRRSKLVRVDRSKSGWIERIVEQAVGAGVPPLSLHLVSGLYLHEFLLPVNLLAREKGVISEEEGRKSHHTYLAVTSGNQHVIAWEATRFADIVSPSEAIYIFCWDVEEDATCQ